MPRFTISQHSGAGKHPDHFDLFLEKDGTLKSWRLPGTDLTEPLKAVEAKDHALKYLDFEGKLTGEKGSVTPWDTGTYLEDTWTPSAIQVAVVGRRVKTRLRITRTAIEGPSIVWTIEDATPAVRRTTSALLSEPTPDPAPSPELDEIHEALNREEHALVAIASQVLKPSAVEWTLAATDAALRERILAELSKWRHPWLEAAKRRAAVLDELAKAVTGAKPK